MKKFFNILLICTLFLVFALNVSSFFTVSTQALANVEEEIYKGKVYHIFFHSLILYPNLAFSGKNAKKYNDWMTTRNEFKAILNKLYENDFMLVDIDYVQKGYSTGGFRFPKGKKPLIISVDDVNYYDYMKGDGFAEKLIVDEGNIACLVKTPKGKYIVDYEGDAAPILDRFLEIYPQFSYKGARGILAVTGFQGVFGYRITTLAGAELASALSDARQVATALKNEGWKIACHSYTHSNRFKDGSISVESLKNDIDKWQKKIAPVVGKSNIFIAPFGTQFPVNSEQFKEITRSGFNVYCSVCKNMNSKFANDCLISERLNFDGFTMMKYPSRITKCFFELDGIIDKSRYNIVSN